MYSNFRRLFSIMRWVLRLSMREYNSPNCDSSHCRHHLSAHARTITKVQSHHP